MPVDFALWGLALLGLSLLVINAARLDSGRGAYLIGLAAFLFVAVMVINTILVAQPAVRDAQMVLVAEGIAAGIGWLALLGALVHLRRHETE